MFMRRKDITRTEVTDFLRRHNHESDVVKVQGGKICKNEEIGKI